MFLKVKGQDFVSDDAVLLTITPRKIAGVKLDQKQFADSYTPYRYFVSQAIYEDVISLCKEGIYFNWFVVLCQTVPSFP